MIGATTPLGLRPNRHGQGGVIRLNQYFIAGGLASNIFRGSAVIPTGTSKQINVAAAAAKIIGVFWGCNYLDSGNNTQFQPKWLSGTAIAPNTIVEASVYDDPFIIFEIQVSGVAGLVPANVGLLADLVIGVGNPVTGNSADQLDQTTIGTSGSTFLIDDVKDGSLATFTGFGQFAIAKVRCAKHFLLGGTLTAE